MKFGRLILIGLAVTVGLLLLVIVGAVISVFLMGMVQKVPGLGWVDHWMVLPALILFWPMIPDRFKAWHMDYAIRGSTVIDAPPREVWNLVYPRAGHEHFQRLVKEIRSVPGAPTRMDFVYENVSDADPLPPLQAEIEEAEELTYFRIGYHNVEDYPLWAGDLVTSEYFLEHENGQTRLTLIENLNKLRISTVLSLLFLNPCRDSIMRAKALCEGVPDTSWMSRMQEQMETDAGGSSEMTRSANLIGFTICAFLTLFALGLAYGLIYFLPAS